ncbi:MAG: hypothetical protein HOK54_18130 [Alphaproteobacteria bacterium]|jgi:hypothetical protein|nr:hypothetical protein [Alphaproteobacteria bacterium]
MKSTDLPPRHTFSGILVLMLSLGLSACVGLPKIADTTTPWTDLSITREFSVEIDVPADKFTVTNLSIYFSRHFWPGESTANSDSVTGTGNTGSASFAPPWANTFPTSHTVFYRWVATLLGTSPGATPFTIKTPLTRFVVGCTQADTDAQLTAAMAANSVNFATTTPHLRAIRNQLGYGGEPHQRSVVTGNGYTLSRRILEVLADTIVPGGTGGLADPPVLAEPTLLFYAPRLRAPGEAVGDYVADMADPNSNNAPYTFIGVAYATQYDAANRPLLGCVPSDAWFVHEAGYHFRDGTMGFANFADNQTGTQNINLPPPTWPLRATLWHPRLWDLHVWFDPAGGPPILSIFEPNTETTPDDPTDPPNFRAGVARGLFLPNGPPGFPLRTFFRPTTSE